MPEFCAAFGCCNERSAETEERGITFYGFPQNKYRRKIWTKALRRRDLEPDERSVVCSCHFKTEDFERYGSTTRLKEGVIPSVLTTADHLPKVQSIARFCRRSHRPAAECRSEVQVPQDLDQSISDHQYALDPVQVKHQLTEARKKVKELQKDLMRAKVRERRLKNTVVTDWMKSLD